MGLKLDSQAAVFERKANIKMYVKPMLKTRIKRPYAYIS